MKTRDFLFGFRFLIVVAITAFSAQITVALDAPEFKQPIHQFAPVYGVAIGFVILGGLAFLPAVFLGTLIPMLRVGGDFLFVISMPLAVTVSALVAYHFLYWRLQRISAEKIRDSLMLVFGGAVGMTGLGTAVETVLALAAAPHLDPSGLLPLFMTNWLAASVGAIITLPFMVAWSQPETDRPAGKQVVEVAIWFCTLILFGYTTFRNWAPTDVLLYPMELAIFPIMAWASIRFGMRGASAGVLALALLAGAVLIPFGEDEFAAITRSSSSVWTFIGIVSITSVVLAAVMAEFRRREARIAENENRLRAFTDALPDIVFILTRNGLLQEGFAANRQIEANHRIMNIRAIQGKHIRELFDEHLTARFLETIERALRLHQVAVLEYALDSVDVGTHWFEARVSPMRSAGPGQADRVAWVAYDISDRKKFESELVNRDRVLMATAKACADLLVKGDPQSAVDSALGELGRALGVDRCYVFEINGEDEDHFHSLTARFQWLRSEACPAVLGSPGTVGAPFEECLPGWLEISMREGLIRIDDSGQWKHDLSFLREIRSRALLAVPMWIEGRLSGFLAVDYCGSASHRWLESEINAVRVLSSALSGLLILRDREKKLRDARDRADAASSAKGEFLAIMSHEIRTPMNAIIGYTDLLRQTDLTEVQREQAAVIKRSGSALLDLINNILDYSKIESDTLELENRKFDLEQVVCEALESILPAAKDKGLSVDYKIVDGVEEFYCGDSHRIRQILLNLASNAVKFTGRGSVVMSVALDDGTDPGGLAHRLRFAVKDTGCGIGKDSLERMFEPFSQADSSTTRKYGGTGLGLAISKKLVQRMGGEIGARSWLGEGSEFFFTIELKRHDPKVISNSPFARPAAGDELNEDFSREWPLKLLLCEDDEDNRWVIRELLETLGYAPQVVGDDEELIEKLLAENFDAVLLDIRLPGRSGLELSRLIRRGAIREELKDQYLIAVTAFALEDDREKCFQAGMNDYLSKPLEIHRLKEALIQAHVEVAGRSD